MRTSGCSHKKRVGGVDDVLAPEEDAHPPGGRLDVREGERERSKGDDAHGGSWTGGVRSSEREEDGEAPGRRWLTDCEGRCRSFGQWLARSNTARLRRRDHVEKGRGTRGARKHTCNARLVSIAFHSLTAACLALTTVPASFTRRPSSKRAARRRWQDLMKMMAM